MEKPGERLMVPILCVLMVIGGLNLGAVAGPGTLEVTFGTSPASGDAPLNVAFVSHVDSGTGPYTYYWDFKDGQTSTLENPSHTFTNAGNYSVTLKVTDSVGAEKTSTNSIVVTTKEEKNKGFISGFEIPVLLIAFVSALVVVGRRKK